MKSIIIISLFCISVSRASEMAADFVHQPVELEEQNIVKRQAPAPAPARKEIPDNYTSVKTEGGCKLYALEVVFFKRTSKSEPGKFDISEVAVPGTSLKSIKDGNCKNWTGMIELKYEGHFPARVGQGSLTSLTLIFNITYRKPFSWWELSELEVSAEGELKPERSLKFEGNIMRQVAIGASKKFSYACGAPPTMFYSMDEKAQTVYGIKFRNLQIQPFEWSRSPGNFTDYVDDCVPFFSIGIWMFLVVATVLLLVVFCGIGMISSLKTMDRFDDPKGKPMVINAKE